MKGIVRKITVLETKNSLKNIEKSAKKAIFWASACLQTSETKSEFTILSGMSKYPMLDTKNSKIRYKMRKLEQIQDLIFFNNYYTYHAKLLYFTETMIFPENMRADM